MTSARIAFVAFTWTSVFLNLNDCKFRWMVLTYYCLLLAENAVTSFF